jgi:hypothetical protein
MIAISEEKLKNIGITLAGSPQTSNKKLLNKLNELEDIEITIEDLFNFILEQDKQLDKLENRTEVAICNETELITNNILSDTKIKNVSCHKVSKNKWEISIKDKEPLYLLKIIQLLFIEMEN